MVSPGQLNDTVQIADDKIVKNYYFDHLCYVNMHTCFDSFAFCMDDLLDVDVFCVKHTLPNYCSSDDTKYFALELL